MARKGGGLAAIMAGQPMVTVKKKTRWERFKKASIASGHHIALIIGCILYVFIGAHIFIAIEGPHEQQIRSDTEEIVEFEKLKLFARIDMAVDQYTGEDAKLNETMEVILDEYTKQMFSLFKHPISANVFESEAYFDGEYQELWTTSSAILFTSTTVIPVGFGLITPLTSTGRISLIIYAIVGIPLVLVTLSDIGKFFCDSTFRLFGERESLYIASLLFLLFAYPFIGAIMIQQVSNLTFLESIYYSVITMLTVGFGDIGPPIPIPFLLLFIIFGVTLVTLSVDVLAATAIHHIHYLGRQVGNAKAIAGKMLAMAQKISINKSLGMGMAQLGVFARFGVMMKIHGDNASFSPTVPPQRRSTAFDPQIAFDFVDEKGEFNVFESFSEEDCVFIDGEEESGY